MQSSMKAWQVSAAGAPGDVMVMGDRALPDPGPGELQIAVAAAALGLPDVMMCRDRYDFKPPRPFTPGQEMAGTVLQVGEGVSLQPGQRVMGVTAFFNGYGGFAQQCMSMEGMVYPVPDTMPDSDAAAFTIPYHTAWLGLVNRGTLVPGETLLVLGAAGGSGCAAIQLGKALGARVIAVAGGAQKLARCRELGADALVDHRQEDLAQAVLEQTAGKGADVVFDPVGGAAASAALACVANEGRMLAVGFASGSWADLPAHELVLKNAGLIGVYVGAYSPEQRAEVHRQLLLRYDAGDLQPPLADAVSFAGIPAALDALEARKVSGKLVARID